MEKLNICPRVLFRNRLIRPLHKCIGIIRYIILRDRDSWVVEMTGHLQNE